MSSPGMGSLLRSAPIVEPPAMSSKQASGLSDICHSEGDCQDGRRDSSDAKSSDHSPLGACVPIPDRHSDPLVSTAHVQAVHVQGYDRRALRAEPPAPPGLPNGGSRDHHGGTTVGVFWHSHATSCLSTPPGYGHASAVQAVLAFASQYGVVDAVREVNADFQAPIAAGVSPQGPTVGAEEAQVHEQLVEETLTWLWDLSAKWLAENSGGQGPPSPQGATLVLLTNLQNLASLLKRVRSRGVRVVLVSDSELASASGGSDADKSLGIEHVHSSCVWGRGGALGMQDHHREYGAPAWVGQPCDHAPAAAAGAGTAPTHRNVIAAHVHAEAKGATGHSEGDFEGHSSHERGRAVEPLIARAADGNSGRARADAGVGREDGADARTTYVSAVNPATPHDAGVSMGEATQAKEALPVSLPATARSPRLAASRPLAMPRNGDGPQDGTLEWTRTREEERLVEKDMDDGTRGLRWRGAAVGVEECMEERDALVPLEGGRLQASAPAPPVTSLLRGTPLTLMLVAANLAVLFLLVKDSFL